MHQFDIISEGKPCSSHCMETHGESEGILKTSVNTCINTVGVCTYWCMLQMVWASTNRVGCAVQTCYNMFVWGVLWREATFLVCNYSPKYELTLNASLEISVSV